GQVENMSVEGLFVHGGDLWRLNTPLSCLQPPQQGKTLLYTVVLFEHARKIPESLRLFKSSSLRL
ncbi:hypothetical protein QR055_13080, partial [Salmonella enterica]|nr:hypothetical protein [Salmonella enterica]MDL3675691.1 hypothetical protein [Salmonella enterica]